MSTQAQYYVGCCRYLAAKAELKDKDRRLLSAEAQAADLQARLSDAVTQRKHWEAEYNVRSSV